MHPHEMLRSLRASTKTAGLLVLLAAMLLACAAFIVLPLRENRFPLVHVAIALACVGIGAAFGFLVRDLIALRDERSRATSDDRSLHKPIPPAAPANRPALNHSPADEQVRQLATIAAQAAGLSNRQIVEAVATTQGLNAFFVEFRSIVRSLEDLAARTDALAAATAPAFVSLPATASALGIEELCLLTRHAAFAIRQSGRALEDCIHRNAESSNLSVQIATTLRDLQTDARRLAPRTQPASVSGERAQPRPEAADPLAAADDLIAQSERLITRIETLLDLAPPVPPRTDPLRTLPLVRPNHPLGRPPGTEPPAAPKHA